MNSFKQSWAVISFVAISLWVALPAVSLPPAPQEEVKDLVESVCGGQCHDLETGTSPGRSREAWQEVVADMVARGASLLLDEVDAVAKYLAENFGPDRSPAGSSNASAQNKDNGNRAAAKEMEAALEFSAKQAGPTARCRKETAASVHVKTRKSSLAWTPRSGTE